MILKKAFLLSFFIGLIGCYNVGSFSTNPSTPPLKPTPECLQVKTDVNELLESNPDFLGAFETFLTDETCALLMVINSPQSRPLDNQETFEECQQAAQWLRTSFPNAIASPQKEQGHSKQDVFVT